MKIGIVADDLTGAADSIAPFAHFGLRTEIGMRFGQDMWDVSEEAEAFALSTETRDLSGASQELIQQATRQATKMVRQRANLVFKKVDSTLRGHLHWELEAMRTELSERMAIVCPAFPALGRVVDRGVLYVHGAPLQGIGEDQTIRSAFAMTSQRSSVEMRLEEVQTDPDMVARRWEGWWEDGVRTVFCDAVETQDLQILAHALLRHPERYLPVGSGGLSREIAAEMGRTVQAHLFAAKWDRLHGRAVIVVVGSLNPVSRRQSAYLCTVAGIQPVSTIDAAIGQLQQGARIALVMTSEFEHEVELFDKKLDIIRSCVQSGGYSMVVTGGATAVQIIEKMRSSFCPRLSVLGELQPGVVVTRFACPAAMPDPALSEMLFVLKAGGFGEDWTLAQCVGLA